LLPLFERDGTEQKKEDEEAKKTAEEDDDDDDGESNSNNKEKKAPPPTPPRKKRQDEEEEKESRSKSPRKKKVKSTKGKSGVDKKKASPKKAKGEQKENDEEEVAFPVSTICYGEMTGDNDYRDTIHKVQVIEIRDDEEERLCRLLAFDFGDDASHTIFKLDELHQTPGRALGGEDDNLDKGMVVHFLFKNRHLGRKKNIDGYYAEAGVWVKGLVVSTDGESVTVSCKDWGNQSKKAKREVTVGREDLMLPWK
jgi:hypothetical protein